MELALAPAAAAAVLAGLGVELRLAFRGAGEADPSANPVLRLVRRTLPTTGDFRGRRRVLIVL